MTLPTAGESRYVRPTSALLDPRGAWLASKSAGGKSRVVIRPSGGRASAITRVVLVFFAATWSAKWEVLLPVVILGSLLGGATTVQSSAVAALYALVIQRFVHRDLPKDQVAPHAHGWDHYLPRLAVAAGGGDPGPDNGPGGS